MTSSGHQKLNNADEKICNLLNAEYSFILKQLDKKFLNGTYAYFVERRDVV